MVGVGRHVCGSGVWRLVWTANVWWWCLVVGVDRYQVVGVDRKMCIGGALW